MFEFQLYCKSNQFSCTIFAFLPLCGSALSSLKIFSYCLALKDHKYCRNRAFFSIFFHFFYLHKHKPRSPNLLYARRIVWIMNFGKFQNSSWRDWTLYSLNYYLQQRRSVFSGNLFLPIHKNIISILIINRRVFKFSKSYFLRIGMVF